jgi:hypothetical protein
MPARPTRFARLTAVAACALAVMTVTLSAQADVAIAEKLFLEGKRLMDEGSYPAACEKFQAAHDLDSTATGTLLNLALCHEQIKRNATAWAEFRQVIAESTGRREDRVTMARAHEAKLFPLLSFLTIRVPEASRAPGIKVDLDKTRPIAEASWGVELPVDPGKHVVDVSAPGKVGRSLPVVVAETADRQTVEVAPLADAPRSSNAAPGIKRPGPEPIGAQRTVGYVLGGVGIVALSAGAIFGGIAMSRNDDAEAAVRGCPGNVCPDEGARTRAQGAIDDATTYANAANITVGVGLALIVASVVLVVTAKSEAPTTASLFKTKLMRHENGATFAFGSRW